MAPKLQQMPSSAQHCPRPGDRVLRIKREWLQLILAGTKTAEVRSGPTTPGGAWLGYNGRVWARVHIGEPEHILTMDDFRSKHAAHRVEVDELPYGLRTFLWPLSELRPLAEPVWFHNRSGPVTWMRFAPPPSATPSDVSPRPHVRAAAGPLRRRPRARGPTSAST